MLGDWKLQGNTILFLVGQCQWSNLLSVANPHTLWLLCTPKRSEGLKLSPVCPLLLFQVFEKLPCYLSNKCPPSPQSNHSKPYLLVWKAWANPIKLTMVVIRELGVCLSQSFFVPLQYLENVSSRKQMRDYNPYGSCSDTYKICLEEQTVKLTYPP